MQKGIPCLIQACGKPSIGRGWCTKHYQRWVKYGDPRPDLDGPRRCAGCLVSYTPTRTDQKHCTRKCATRTASRRHQGLSPVVPATRPCAWCEESFTHDDGRRLYCGESCARIGALLVEVPVKYGITIAEYRRLLREQGGLCAICRTEQTTKRRVMLSVDHCHETLQVRGLLCNNCNTAIGLLKDSPEVIRSAADYVQRNRQMRLVV